VIQRGGTGLIAKSPSMVFMELGKNIVQGLALGITDNAYLAHNATDYMMKIPSKASKVLGTGAGGATGPAVHIDQVVFQDQTDMRAFMNMADFYIQQGRVG
jgi:hypothetical protein